jgi:hypothetical protein
MAALIATASAASAMTGSTAKRDADRGDDYRGRNYSFGVKSNDVTVVILVISHCGPRRSIVTR